MTLGSNNSWSFLKPKKWYHNLFRWYYRHQDYDIQTQYNRFGVKCFELKVRADKFSSPVVTNGYCEFDINIGELYKDMGFLNDKGDAIVIIKVDIPFWYHFKRCNASTNVLLEIVTFVRNTFPSVKLFINDYMPMKYERKCGATAKPKWLKSIYPRLWAKNNNHKVINSCTDKDILSVDFVNYR